MRQRFIRDTAIHPAQFEPIEFPESIEKAKAYIQVLKIDMDSFERSYQRKIAAKESGGFTEESFEKWEYRWEAARVLTERKLAAFMTLVHETEQAAESRTRAAELALEAARLRDENEQLRQRVAELSLEDTKREISERYGRFGERKLLEKIAGQNIALNNLQTAYNGLAAKYEALKSGTPAPPPVPPSEEKEARKRATNSMHQEFARCAALITILEESGIKLPLLAIRTREKCLESMPAGFYERWRSDRMHAWIEAYGASHE
jgi:regulator of replication initiation timing